MTRCLSGRCVGRDLIRAIPIRSEDISYLPAIHNQNSFFYDLQDAQTQDAWHAMPAAESMGMKLHKVNRPTQGAQCVAYEPESGESALSGEKLLTRCDE